MINIDEIKKNIQNWIYTQSGLTTIWANQIGAPKPDLPFISINLTSMSQIGRDNLSSPDVTGVAKISGDRGIIISVQAFGTGAMVILENLHQKRYIEDSKTDLTLNGIAFIGASIVQDITGINDIDYEERAVSDFSFRFVSQDTNIDVGYIDNITIEGELKEPDHDIDFDIDI